MLIHLIGPGGAGKSTTGQLLAAKLKIPCIDLDAHYLRHRDISRDVRVDGYESYVVARQLAKSHFTGSRAENTKVIRERFHIYAALGNIKISTLQPIEKVVEAALAALKPRQERV